MKRYASMGMGVNSVAMLLMLLDQKDEFEAIFVDHGTDWPETYEYLEMFQAWLEYHGHDRITVLKPGYKYNGIHNNLYDYCIFRRVTPSVMQRWCTGDFKVKPIHKYIEKPCFMMVGIDTGEAHRAKISTENGIEKRYPLIENDIDREGCKNIIMGHGLPIPKKSGCYICPFQKRSQWIELRLVHPCLFQKAVDLEKLNIEYRVSKGKKPLTLSSSGKSLPAIVDEYQGNLFEQDNYPPCQCGL